MSIEIKSLMKRLGYAKSSLWCLNKWKDKIKQNYAKDMAACERDKSFTLALIDELENAISIEKRKRNDNI